MRSIEERIYLCKMLLRGIDAPNYHFQKSLQISIHTALNILLRKSTNDILKEIRITIFID
jgi:hypothetical protein